MRLYKVFNDDSAFIVGDGFLCGPVMQRFYHDEDGHILTLANAVGFVARPVKHQIRFALNGYHVLTSRGLRLHSTWSKKPGAHVYIVELIEEEGNRPVKKVGRSFRIIREAKPWEIRRVLRDNQRSHKAKVKA